MKRLLVIGGGISGLAAAWRARSLSKTVEITLLEKEDRLGGKILTESRDGFLLEAGADGFLSRKRGGIDLCNELGISSLLRGQVKRNVRSFVMQKHGLHTLPDGFTGLVPGNLHALEETALLSEAGKLRGMQEPSVPPRADKGDESVSRFMTRRFGKEVFETLIEPLLAGIYAGDADCLSMKATLPRLLELEWRNGSVLRGLSVPAPADLPPFVTFSGGMSQMVSEIRQRLVDVRLVTGTAAGRITRSGHAWLAGLAGGGEIEADSVIVAVPAGQAAPLFAGVDSTLGEALSSIPFASTAIVHLGYHRHEIAHDLDGYGYVIPRIEGSDFSACTWTSSKWEDRAPRGMALLRLYTRRRGSDNELQDLARAELRQTMGIAARPVLVRIFRWPEAMPQYTLEHPARLEVIESRCAGLEGMYLAGASYRGVGIPDCIESGSHAARAAMESLL